MGHPVKLPGVDNRAADGGGMPVDILGGRMGDDVGAPFDRAAVDGGREGIVDDQRDAVFMGAFGKEGDVQDGQGGVRDRLAKDRLGVRLKGGV